MTHLIPRGEQSLGHWLGPATVVSVGCALAWIVLAFGHGALLAVAVLAVAVALAAWNSPLRRGGHEPLCTVNGAGGVDPAVVVLWRPGCPYSAELRRRVSREGLRVHWVNIWRDQDAYALCRSINKGSEETPTAMLLDPAAVQPVVIPASVTGLREAATDTGTPAGTGHL